MARRRKIQVGDTVNIVNNSHYAGHWGVVQRIDVETNPHFASDIYHVTGGSIGALCPLFDAREVRLRTTDDEITRLEPLDIRD